MSAPETAAAAAAAAAGAEAAPEVDEDSIMKMFDGAKKKKKRKPARTEGDDSVSSGGALDGVSSSSGGAAPVAGEDASVAGATSAVAGLSVGAAGAGASESAEDAVHDFTYDQMLSRAFALLQKNNPELTSRTKQTLKPPQVRAKRIHRTQDHVLSFFLAELGTTGAIDGSERLLLRGKYVPKYIESLLRKYIGDYVTCAMCRSLDTALTRDPVSRLFFMSCQSCGSTRSVTPIKAGFTAVKKGERRKARLAGEGQ